MFVKIAGADNSFSRLIDRLEKIAVGVASWSEDDAGQAADAVGLGLLKHAALAPLARHRAYPLHVTQFTDVVQRSQ